MGAYGDRGSAGKDEAHWLELYDGGPRMFDRVLRPDVYVPNWGASLVGGIQPDVIQRIANKLPNNGLLQRFIPVIGQQQQAVDRHMDMRPVNAFDDLLERLYRVPPSETPVKMSIEADEVRKRVFDHLGGLMTSFESLNARLAAHVGKWEGLYCRLVLVMHCVDCVERDLHPTNELVSPESALLVEQLMFKYLMPHLMCFYGGVLEDSGGADQRMDDVRKIGEHILTKGWQTFTDRIVTHAVKRWRFRNSKEKAETYATLGAMGWISPAAESKPDLRGIAASYVVNPTVHNVFATAAARFAQSMKLVADMLNGSGSMA